MYGVYRDDDGEPFVLPSVREVNVPRFFSFSLFHICGVLSLGGWLARSKWRSKWFMEGRRRMEDWEEGEGGTRVEEDVD